MSKILLKNGRVIDPANGVDETTDLLIVDQKISQIGEIKEGDGMKVVDCSGKIVMPGAIDLHVHLRDMEQEDKETIETGTLAARKGGVTTVFAMPNTDPQLCSTTAIERYMRLARNSRVNLHVVGAITKHLEGKELANMEAYLNYGIQFVSDDGYDVNDEALLKEAYVKAKELGLGVITHPEMDSIGKGGVVNEGKVSKTLGVPGQPNEKEWKAVERAIRMAKKTGARAHITHISTKESVELVRRAKAEGLPVTSDATEIGRASCRERV